MEAVAGAPREVSDEDKKLSADWLKRIETALARHKDQFATFEKNRKLVRGIAPDGTKRRANLHFANLATLRPQIYAKDPEYSIQPAKGVPEDQIKAAQNFCEVAEAALSHYLVKEAKLKKRAKRLLTSAYTTSVGWWKLIWQEDKRTDPLSANPQKDGQDNEMRLQRLEAEASDPQAGTDAELKKAQAKQTREGLQSQAEVKIRRGLVLDFVMAEDILILDASVRELGDYERASAIAHRVWMTRESYRDRFGYECSKGKSYAEKENQTSVIEASGGDKKGSDLLCVWEIWEQASNRVFHVCDGEPGFCDPPSSPNWTGERWYPFFGLAFNEIEGTFYPLSDVELTEPLVAEYNESRDDFVRDRKRALPIIVVRKGGSLTDGDVKRINHAEGGDIVMVEGVGGQPIGNDIWTGQMGKLDPQAYDTSASRADMEQLIGGGDASRGSVLKAKTATEAEILSQGLRSRSGERQDTMEDLLTDLGINALQILLRKLTPEEVAKVAGPEASWPTLSVDQVFEQVTVEVRGGSTGKPDRLQEQDRWTKLMPVIKETMQQVAELRASGQDPLAEALIELTRETLRRFDERLDLDQYLPKPKEGEEGEIDPAMVQQAQELIQQQQQRIAELTQQLEDKESEIAAEVRKAEINADKDIKVATVKAPIEAQAKVEVARINAAASVEAPAEPSMPSQVAPTEPQADVLGLIQAIAQGQAELRESVASLASRPPRQIAFHRDSTGQITGASQVDQPEIV